MKMRCITTDNHDKDSTTMSPAHMLIHVIAFTPSRPLTCHPSQPASSRRRGRCRSRPVRPHRAVTPPRHAREKEKGAEVCIHNMV